LSWRVHNLVKSKVIGKTINPEGKSCSAVIRKIVLLAYADVAAHDGSGVFVAKKTIAAEQEIHRSSVIAATQSLLDDGLLVLDDSKFEGGRRPGAEGFTYLYRIAIARVQALPDAIPGKCRNSDTLDDATIDGDELAEQYLKAARRGVNKSRKVSATPTLKVSESGSQSVGRADMNLNTRTINTRARDSVHRRADPDYANDRPSQPPPEDAETLRLEKKLIALRRHLATAAEGKEIVSGDYAGMLPNLAARAIREEIADLENRLAQKRVGA
jgi:hypothetical protein